jgi:hypothetical protein
VAATCAEQHTERPHLGIECPGCRHETRTTDEESRRSWPLCNQFARRLSQMEALLIEMRHEQDVKLKRIIALQVQLETLTQVVRGNSRDIRRLSLHGK